MRELSDLLREIKQCTENEDKMEFCEDFAKLQTIFNHTNQFVRTFDRIVFHGGNEPYIIEIVARLVKYLRIRRYLNEDNKPIRECDNQLRKITLFMILNTDASFKFDLMKDTKICHVLNTVPQLTKCLLVNCIWGASLDKYFYEMLSYSPQWFMMQFIEQAVTSMKFAKPFEILERVEAMVKAIYYSICRTDCDWKRIDRNRFVEQQRILSKLFDFLMDLLRFFNTPDMSKFERWSRMRMHRYYGFALKHIFAIVLYCFDLYLNQRLFEVEDEMSIYQIMGEKHVTRKEIPEAYSPGTDSHLVKINNCLLNTLQTCVMEVTIDSFMYWVEIDVVADGAEQLTLQQIIGESAYKLMETLKENKLFQHNVLKQLPSISLRPKSQAEKAMELSMRDLMDRVENTKDVFERRLFFSEFIRRGSQVFGNNECLNLIEQNLELISGDNVRKMVEYDNRPTDEDEMEEDGLSEEAIRLKELILKGVDNLLMEEATTLIKHMMATYGLEYDRYQTPDLVEQIVEYTNKFNSNSMQLGDEESLVPMRLIFQCPSLFYSRLTRSLYESSFNNANYIYAITRVIASTRPLSVPYLSAQVRSLLSNEFEVTKSNSLSVFVLKLYERDLFERNNFLQGYLLQGADEAFQKSNFRALLEILGITQLVVDKNLNGFKLDTLKQVVLKMAELSEQLRFDVTKLQPEHPQGVDRVVLLEKMLKIMLGPVRMLRAMKEESKQRYKAETQRFAPITKYYFQRSFVDLSAGKTVQEFAKFLYQGDIDENTPKIHVRLFLSKTLVQCTNAEADKLARDPLLLPHISDAVLIILVLLTEQERHYECLKNCLSNYLHVVQKHLLPPLLIAEAAAPGQPGPAEQRAALVRSLVKLIVKLPDASRDRLLVALSFGLSAIVRQLRTVDAGLDLGDIEKVLKLEQHPTTVVKIRAAATATAMEQNGSKEDGCEVSADCAVAMVTE
ncbi:uncharacterized protein LOC131692344 [Topomyia yanbarensis]|uniref:uncharacterized protein LOC131692344 n=1 Tax=Topomyia yanbarensis TaxID=2498891 RepID=UPI00273B940E|nr:uncharacterized protein LOC131692344 [Topomyia yanbarensis]